MQKFAVEQRVKRIEVNLGPGHRAERSRDFVLLPFSFRAYDDDLQHTARFLVSLGFPFRVLQPPELVKELRMLARALLDMTTSGQDEPPGTLL